MGKIYLGHPSSPPVRMESSRRETRKGKKEGSIGHYGDVTTYKGLVRHVKEWSPRSQFDDVDTP